MATMMNGYHYDMAKEDGNSYSIKVNNKMLIMGANFSSALAIFKYIEEDIENLGHEDVVELIKDYDKKTKTYVSEIVRSNEAQIEKRKQAGKILVQVGKTAR